MVIVYRKIAAFGGVNVKGGINLMCNAKGRIIIMTIRLHPFVDKIPVLPLLVGGARGFQG